MLWDIHFLLHCSQAPEFDRWSGSSHGATNPLRQSQDKRRSRELQLPNADDNPISPGYAEPLCVSAYLNNQNPLVSSCEHICPYAVGFPRFPSELLLHSLISYLVWNWVRQGLSKDLKYGALFIRMTLMFILEEEHMWLWKKSAVFQLGC